MHVPVRQHTAAEEKRKGKVVAPRAAKRLLAEVASGQGLCQCRTLPHDGKLGTGGRTMRMIKTREALVALETECVRVMLLYA